MKWTIGIAVCMGALAAQAQNLVTNGDFETYTQCPDYVSQIDRATGWFRPTEGTSDYFNACLGVPFSENVPDNEFGDQLAHSANGYAGFYCFYSTTAVTTAPDGDHEYVTHALAAPLVPGETYTVEFFVSLADVSKYAVNDIGALLSVHAPHRMDSEAITATPQFMNTSLAMLDDKSGWARIHGCFVADSAFAFITVGNFHVGASTVFEEVPTSFPLTWYSYYYVDDVSVQHIEPPQLGPDLSICDATAIAVLNPAVGATYTWSTGEVGTSIIVDTAGMFSVQLDAGGCLLTDTIQVMMSPHIALHLPADTAVDFCTTPSLMLDAGPLPPNANVLWSTGASTMAITVQDPGTYAVTISAPDYCPGSAIINVIDACVLPVFVPDAFTPDGDGINDVWQPVWHANSDALIALTVFDRWGRVIFSTDSRYPSWDGRVNGTPAPADIYAWLLQARDRAAHADQQFSGHMTLVR